MLRPGQVLLVAVALLVPPFIPASRLSAQVRYLGPAASGGRRSYPDVEERVQAARTDLGSALARRQDRGAARKLLKRSQETLEKALRSNPRSRPAAEALGVVYRVQGDLGDRDGYERCTRFLEQVYAVDPEATEAPRHLAFCYAGQGKGQQALTYANQAAALTSDPDARRELVELRRVYQEAFLGSWYEYGGYYESPGARVTRFNPQTRQIELVAQITPQFEADLAARSFQQLAPQLRMAQEPELQAYLQKLVNRLVAGSPVGPPFMYRVDVVESPEVNAMAFPGRIVVNTGLVKFAESEAELMSVLAHELAHVYAHHSSRALVASYNKRMVAGTVLSLARVDNSNLREVLVSMGVAIGLELLDRGFSRGEEKEADRLGTHIAFNAGYNPTYMTKMFVRLYEANPKQPFKLLATHPPTPDRIQYTTAYLEMFPLETEMQIDSQEFQDIKQRLR